MNIQLKAKLVGITILVVFFCIGRVSLALDDEMTWFNKANENISNEEKIICYLQAVRINPKFVAAYYNLGLVYKALKDYKKAGNAFQKALLANPESLTIETRTEIIIELGIVQKNLKLYSQAIETLNTAKNLARETEHQSKILYELGQVKLLSGEFNEAIKYFNEGMQFNGSNRVLFAQAKEIAQKNRDQSNYYERGLYFLEQGQYEDAEQALQKVVDENPDYKDAASKMATAKKRKNQQFKLDQLSNIYDRAIELMKNEDWQNAILTFQQIGQADSNYRDVRIKMAEAKAQLNKFEAYGNIYAEAIAAYTEGDWHTALSKFSEVINWNPDFKDAKTWHLNTQAKLQSNRPDFQFFESNDASVLTSSETTLPETEIILNENKNREVLNNDRYHENKLPVVHTNFNKANFANQTGATVIRPSNPEKHQPSWFIIGVIFSITFVPAGVSLLLIPTSRAKLCLLLKKYTKAASIYESLVMKNPNKSKLYLTLAQIYLLQNRTDNTAIGVYQFVLQQYQNPPMKQTMQEIVSKKYQKKNKKSILDILGKELLNELHKMGTA